MFPVKTYVSRRAELRAKTGGGLILLPGNQPSANNYPNNAYYFRQDSTFLYYFGLDRPSLAGVIDADTGEEVLFGDDFTVDDIIWTGPQPTLREEGARAGVADCRPLAALADYLAAAIRLGRRIHYLPPYRGETKLQLSALLGIAPALLHDYKSVDLMFAVAEMREVKSAEEVAQMEDAFHIGYAMHSTAMRMCRAGAVDERVHLPQLVLVDHRIDRQVALHPRRAGDPDDTFQIVRREIRGRLRPHVELPHTEIDGVGSGLYGRLQRLVAPGRSHQFYVASFHLECFSRAAALFRQRSASQAVHPSRTTDCNPLRLVRLRSPRPNREFFREIESSISCAPSGCGRTRAAAPCAHQGRSVRRASPAHGRNAAKSAAP